MIHRKRATFNTLIENERAKKYMNSRANSRPIKWSLLKFARSVILISQSVSFKRMGSRVFVYKANRRAALTKRSPRNGRHNAGILYKSNPIFATTLMRPLFISHPHSHLGPFLWVFRAVNKTCCDDFAIRCWIRSLARLKWNHSVRV